MLHKDLIFHFCTESRGCAKLSDDNKNVLFIYESNFMTIQFCVEICRGQGELFAALRVSSIITHIILLVYNFFLQNFKKVQNCYCLENLKNSSMVPNTFCNGLCSGNTNQKCGSQEEQYHSIYYVGSYFDVLNGKEGGFICVLHRLMSGPSVGPKNWTGSKIAFHFLILPFDSYPCQNTIN